MPARNRRKPPLRSEFATGRRSPRPGGSTTFASSQPAWLADNRQLWLGSVLVKFFPRFAPNQIMLLNAFAHADWPKIMENPLAPLGNVAAEEAFRDVVKKFNRSQAVIHLGVKNAAKTVTWTLCGGGAGG